MKKLFMAAVIIILLAVFSLEVGYFLTNPRNSQTDTSWIETANNLLQNYSSSNYINSTENPGLYLAYLRVALFDNGTLYFLHVGNGDNLSGYLENVLKQASVEKAVDDSFLDNVLSVDRVVWLNYRLSVMRKADKYYSVYFILNDNLNAELQGKILAIDKNTNNCYLLEV